MTNPTTSTASRHVLAGERLTRLRDWSNDTFGPGPRLTSGLTHIRKELKEIEENPADITEWADAVILTLSTAMRQGHTPHDLITAILQKMDTNENRVWPDWRQFADDQVIEHDRTHDQ